MHTAFKSRVAKLYGDQRRGSQLEFAEGMAIVHQVHASIRSLRRKVKPKNVRQKPTYYKKRFSNIYFKIHSNQHALLRSVLEAGSCASASRSLARTGATTGVGPRPCLVGQYGVSIKYLMAHFVKAALPDQGHPHSMTPAHIGRTPQHQPDPLALLDIQLLS